MSLQLLNSLLGIATNKSIAAKPSKIVAGQEPEKTNELLQIIGMAIQSKIDSRKAIEEWRAKQVSKGSNNSKVIVKKKGTSNKTTTSKVSNSNNSNKKSIPPPTTIEKLSEDAAAEKKPRVDSGIVEDGNSVPDEPVPLVDSEQRKSSLEVVPDVPIKSAEEEQKQDSSENGLIESSNEIIVEPESTTNPKGLVDEKQELINAIDEEADRRKRDNKAAPSRNSSSENLLKKEEKSLDSTVPKQVATDEVKINPPVVKKESSQSSRKPTSNKGVKGTVHPPPETKAEAPRPIRPRTSLRPPSVRPASARPGAPRKRDRVVIQPDENVQLGDINVKVEHFKTSLNDDDDDDNLIVIENIQDSLLKQEPEIDIEIPGDGSNQGQLVKQILESQKEFVSGADATTQREVVPSSIIELRDQIQKLTKSIQPLGKFMDFLLEDIDSMQREYEMWRDRGKEVSLKLAREKNSTQNNVHSLKHQLEELDGEIEEKRSAVITTRENILVNEERIAKLFRSL